MLYLFYSPHVPLILFCPSALVLAKPCKKVEVLPFEGSYEDRPCVKCTKKYKKHKPKIQDLGDEFAKVCDRYTGQMYHKRRNFKQGQNIGIDILDSDAMQKQYSWVKISDEVTKHGKDLGELKDGDNVYVNDGEDDETQDEETKPFPAPAPGLGQDIKAASGGAAAAAPAALPVVRPDLFSFVAPVSAARPVESADSVTTEFKLKPNQELRFEVKADSNGQARRTSAVLVLKKGFAEICGAELAEGREYASLHASAAVFSFFLINILQVRVSRRCIHRCVLVSWMYIVSLRFISRRGAGRHQPACAYDIHRVSSRSAAKRAQSGCRGGYISCILCRLHPLPPIRRCPSSIWSGRRSCGGRCCCAQRLSTPRHDCRRREIRQVCPAILKS
jgi:hypothetical protein